MNEYSFWVEGDNNTYAAQRIRDIVQKWFGLESQSCIFFDKNLIFLDCYQGSRYIGGIYEISYDKEGGKSKTNIFLKLV